MRIGIVTGASSGLGRAFARRLDRSGIVEELWLIARREERLVTLASELDCSCRLLPLDLTRRESLDQLQALLQAEKPVVEVLVCAAGLGKFGLTEDLTLEENHAMIALNCEAAVNVTRLCLPWLGRRSRVLEISSCASFQPLPGLNLYAATKAFLTSYTRALRRELEDREVRVTAVCPSWIRTEFESVARQTARPDTVAPFPRWAQRPEAVAAWALTMNSLGGEIATCSPVAAAQRLGTKLLPTAAVLSVWQRFRRRSH